MTNPINIATPAGAMALGLFVALSAASAAQAQPSGKATAFFPHPTSPAIQDTAKAAAKCDCPMMEGDAAMLETCMSQMGERPTTPPKG